MQLLYAEPVTPGAHTETVVDSLRPDLRNADEHSTAAEQVFMYLQVNAESGNICNSALDDCFCRAGTDALALSLLCKQCSVQRRAALVLVYARS